MDLSWLLQRDAKDAKDEKRGRDALAASMNPNLMFGGPAYAPGIDRMTGERQPDNRGTPLEFAGGLTGGGRAPDRGVPSALDEEPFTGQAQTLPHSMADPNFRPLGDRQYDQATDQKYIDQRLARGTADVAWPLDWLNKGVNAGLADVGYWTGTEPYQFGMPTQGIADAATKLTGADIVKPEDVSPMAQKAGAAAEMTSSAASDPFNWLGLGAGKTAGKVGEFSKFLNPDAPLPRAPHNVEGPVPAVVDTSSGYARDRGIPLRRQTEYADVNPARGRRIANAYDRMEHAPQDPKVAAAYGALDKETMAQWDALQKAGAKIEFMPDGMPDPYPGGPRDALADLRTNNHLWVFPTVQGYGSGVSDIDVASNPLLRPTGINHGGHDMLVNDAFRAVHDYFGHGMEGAHFGPRGEENAWLSHMKLYSPEAMSAATSELRGQNSWVNFGPFAEANRANPRGTVYADQKTGLLPDWAFKEQGMPLSYRAAKYGLPAAGAAAAATSGSSRREDR